MRGCSSFCGGRVVEFLEARRLLSASLSATFTAGLPAVLPPTAATRITVHVANDPAAQRSGRLAVSIYASSDPVFDSADVLLGSRTGRRNGLAAGASTNLPVKVSAPAGALADGDYYLIACVQDSAAGQATAPAVTLASATTVNYRQPFVDLVTVFTQTPSAAMRTNGFSSSQRSATVRIVNIGNSAAVGRGDVSLYLSNSSVLSESAPQVAHASVGGLRLAPGRSRTIRLHVNLIPGTVAGSYQLFGVTHTDNRIMQRNATNRVAAAARPMDVVSTVSDDQFEANANRRHRRCIYYDGSVFCTTTDAGGVGDSGPVFAGETPPADADNPPSTQPGAPATGPTTSPTTNPASPDDSENSGLPDAQTDIASEDAGDNGGNSGGDGGDSGGDSGGDGSGDGSDDSGDDSGGDSGGGDDGGDF